ncbi:uncharacterized protein LOC125498909 [Beta vulgaris subsp. vulgaris]|uniref:uncharacterized protein LOC125498909 n=1 Tax=Beta vulgaris subsp. vulgaris TaxID=3555 RepID=UPI002547DB26|nr:uncharacterized protein LOC125498909 [Beta vulgaris subsp. vulgaris]
MNYGSSIVDCNPLDIPLYGFEFVPFGDILAKKGSDVYLIATIEDIDVGYSWYYDGCNRCMSGVIREDDVIRCRKENVVLRSTTPRFKIKLIVADKSGDASFMMFDKEVSKLVGRTAKEMVASQNQMENNEFPEEFKSLLGKRFLFKVTVPYNNGVDQNYSYTVNSTSDEPELINKWIELYVKLENSIVVKKESEAESVQECEENMDLSHSEADSSFSHITPQKRATLLDEHSPLGMQLSTTKKLKSVVPQEEE